MNMQWKSHVCHKIIVSLKPTLLYWPFSSLECDVYMIDINFFFNMCSQWTLCFKDQLYVFPSEQSFNPVFESGINHYINKLILFLECLCLYRSNVRELRMSFQSFYVDATVWSLSVHHHFVWLCLDLDLCCVFSPSGDVLSSIYIAALPVVWNQR